MSAEQFREAAAALKVRHGALLAPLTPSAEPAATEACAALDAARARLQGAEKVPAAQMTLGLK